MSTGARWLLAALFVVGVAYILRWWQLERRAGTRAPEARPGPIDTLTGFVTNFFDTLGIGSFAPTTAWFRARRRLPDEQIPGTLNVGHALPTAAQAFVFIALVRVDVVTLVGMIAASCVGAWLGSGVVARLPRHAVQWGMGAALLVAALLLLATNLQWMPAGGEATGLRGGLLLFAVLVNAALGALMTLGVGLYAPCLVLVSLLGMDPLMAFPIMMGSCAFLMPVGAVRFIEARRYDLRAALGLTLGGIPAVLIAAYVVKSLPLEVLRWLVLGVVLYTALALLRAAGRGSVSSANATGSRET